MKFKVNDLKKHLKSYDPKELIQLIVDLSKLNKDVQDYLSSKFGGEEAIEELFAQAKEKIENEFFPANGFAKLRLAEAKKVITTFEKTTGDKKRTVDLMLFYVELGIEFTLAYGNIDESYYLNIGRMFEKVVGYCNKKEEYYLTFSKRLDDVVSHTKDDGYGFFDYLWDIYYTLVWLDEDEDEEEEK